MIGIVLITHGPIGAALCVAMEHVVGPQTQIASIGIDSDDDTLARRDDIEAAIRHVDRGDGVLLLTDMFGSTPSNLALSFRDGEHVEVLAGVNMPMLVKLAKARPTYTFAECIEHATAAGRKYIYAASHLPEPCLNNAHPCRVPALSSEQIKATRTPEATAAAERARLMACHNYR